MAETPVMDKSETPVLDKSTGATVTRVPSGNTASPVRNPWIVRIFAVAMIPSFASLVALLMYPSQPSGAGCPLWETPGGQQTTQKSDTIENRQSVVKSLQQSVNVSQPSSIASLTLHVHGAVFFVTANPVFSSPLSGPFLIFLGVVFDVTSAPYFYGPEGSYRSLASGSDCSWNLVVSNLTAPCSDDFRGEIVLGGRKKISEKITNWLIPFFHKYPQVGVVEGRYFDRAGVPTQEWTELQYLINGETRLEGYEGNEEQSIGNSPPVVLGLKPNFRPCVVKPNGGLSSSPHSTVSCSSVTPKMIKSFGVASCVCEEEQTLFASPERNRAFVVVHFEVCRELECDVMGYEGNFRNILTEEDV